MLRFWLKCAVEHAVTLRDGKRGDTMAQTQIAIECPVSCRGAPDTLVWEARSTLPLEASQTRSGRGQRVVSRRGFLAEEFPPEAASRTFS